MGHTTKKYHHSKAVPGSDDKAEKTKHGPNGTAELNKTFPRYATLLKNLEIPEEEVKEMAHEKKLEELQDDSKKLNIVWRNVILISGIHLAAIAAVVMIIQGEIMWQTVLFGSAVIVFGGLGITAGAHRCYSHRAFKAKTPLKILLLIMQTVAAQNSMWEWVRDHRVHHKFSDTDADPHNIKRGFFFAHTGWLLVRKHKMVRIKGKEIDMADIESDPVIMFQHKYYIPLTTLISFVIPAYIPYKLWGESLLGSVLVADILRYVLSLNGTWLVNSAAHLWGYRPYDKTLTATENKWVALLAFGEGWHNYHHTFPWDYRTAELGGYRYNPTTLLINLWAKIGWAYDLKTVSPAMVEQRAKRTGDGSFSHGHAHHPEKSGPWGWGDKDIREEDAQITQTLYAVKEE